MVKRKKVRHINREKGGTGQQNEQIEEEEQCVSRVAFLSVCCVLYGSLQHDQGLTALWWQLLAAVEKADQFGFSFRR